MSRLRVQKRFDTAWRLLGGRQATAWESMHEPDNEKARELKKAEINLWTSRSDWDDVPIREAWDKAGYIARMIKGGKAALSRDPKAPGKWNYEVDIRACDCGGSMCIRASWLWCPECGCSRDLVGTAFSDKDFHEGQSFFKPSFNSTRHYELWVNNILGRTASPEVNDVLIQRLRNCVAPGEILSVEAVREMLGEIGRPELNDSATLILRKLTGIDPPVISEALLSRGRAIFSRAMIAREGIYGNGSRRYYPYYIYKIFDAIIPSGDRESRRMLDFIHMQSKKVVRACDAEWRQICSVLGCIVWRPTAHRYNRPLARLHNASPDPVRDQIPFGLGVGEL